MAIQLFEIDKDTGEIGLDKVFISMVPEFRNILQKDRGGVKGDNDGRKKILAKRKFMFIYLTKDVNSILENYDEFARRTEAMSMSELTEKDIDSDVLAAMDKYEQIQNNASKSLQLLRSIKKSIDGLKTYYENMDFNEKDKKGELVHAPNTYLMGLQRIPDVLESLTKMEYIVKKEMQDSGGVRGNTVKGLNEDPI